MDEKACGSKRKRDLRQDATEPGVFLYEGGELAVELGARGDITRVRIGPKVEEIPRGTFRGCTNLTEVQFDEGALLVIGESAFEGCTALRSAFWGCYKLAEVQINEGLQCIGVQAFYGCMALQSVTFPSTLRRLDEKVFHNCINLSEVILLGGQRFLNEEFLARRLPNEEGILRQEMVGILAGDGNAFRYCPLTRVKKKHLLAVSERIARLPFERRLPVEERIRNLSRLELIPDRNVLACSPLVIRDPPDAEAEDDSEPEAEQMVDIQDTSNETARSVYQLLQLIAFHELKESSILVELAMWKSGIDGDRARADCRVVLPGPAKSLILDYCGFEGFLRPAMDGALSIGWNAGLETVNPVERLMACPVIPVQIAIAINIIDTTAVDIGIAPPFDSHTPQMTP
ncbi:hypothetical protein THAOC_09924, partial [Thalassiosira oceanica]